MKILIENENVKSWTDKEAPIIFSGLLKEAKSSIMIQQFCDWSLTFVAGVAGRFDLIKNYYYDI